MKPVLSNIFYAGEIFQSEKIDPLPEMPKWANLNFKIKKESEKKDNFIGPGIYAIFFEDKLIYIGKFLGEKENAFSGDIRDERWRKHLGTITLRDRNISFSSQAVLDVIQNSKLPPSNDINWSSKNLKALLIRDRSRVSTPNRFRFGSKIGWYGDDAVIDTKKLNKFKFLYTAINSQIAKNSEIGLIRSFVSSVETELVKTFKPLCNSTPQAKEIESYGIKEVEQAVNKKLENFAVQNDSIEPEDDYFNTVRNNFLALLERNSDYAAKQGVELIHKICNQYGYREDLEIHFKKGTSGPQLRIRCFAKKSQNIFTMSVKNSSFECLALITPKEYEDLNIADLEVGATKDSLKSKFIFKFSGSFKAIEKVINQSTEKYKSSN